MAKKRCYDLFLQMVELNRAINRLKTRTDRDRSDGAHQRLLAEKEQKLEQLEGLLRSSQ